MDVLAGGLSAAYLPLWGRIPERSGGTVILQEGFGGLLCHNIAGVLQRTTATSVRLDFHMSDGLCAEQVIGSGAVQVPPSTMTARNGRGTAPAAHELRAEVACDIASLAEGSAVAVLLKSRRDLQRQHVLVQAVASWGVADGGRVTRVRAAL